MIYSSNMSMPVNVVIEERDLDGNLISRQERHNLVTLVARNKVRDMLYDGSTGGNISHVGVGTSSSAPTAGATALATEVYRGAMTKKTVSAGSVTFNYYLPSGSANGNTLTEAGLFDASTQGNLYARVAYSGVAKTVSNSITYAWTVSIATT